MEIATVKNLSFKYPDSEKNALSEINITVSEGDFCLICGKSGSGKSTLLRMLTPTLMPRGEKTGTITVQGKEITCESGFMPEVSFVGQSNSGWLVTDKVKSELAFACENLGLGPLETKRRAAEAAALFGFEGEYEKNTNELSIGRRQLLALAAALTTSPKIILLDEPTASLDPLAAKTLFSALERLNRERGITIIIAEHRVEDLIESANIMIFLDGGRVAAEGNCDEVCRALKDTPFVSMLPESVKIFSEDKRPPLGVRGARQRLSTAEIKKPVSEKEERKIGEEIYFCKDIFFRYSKEASDVLNGLSFSAKKGEIISVFGGNGSGKTTLLKSIAFINRPYRGKMRYLGEKPSGFKQKLYINNIAYLPQDPYLAFSGKTLGDELEKSAGLGGGDMTEISERLGLSGLLSREPLDLSGGEAERAAIAKSLLLRPKLLLLDEPTGGLDGGLKEELAALLCEQSLGGMTVVMSTHDASFASLCSDRCCILFAGEIVYDAPAKEFFVKSDQYTTTSSRISRGLVDNAYTVCDLRYSLGYNN